MSSLVSLIASHGPLKLGDGTPEQPDEAVRVAQLALVAAGYRVGTDGVFGPRTQMVVIQFEQQHGLHVDEGVIGAQVAGLLDEPHEAVISRATPLIHESGFPHDDTASLMAFYGNPDEVGFSNRLVGVTPPFPLTYEGKPWPHAIQFNRACADAFTAAFEAIWEAAGRDPASPILKHVSQFSGSYVNRPVRGSSRKSCHAFGAALDFSAESLPMGHRIEASEIPAEVVAAFEAQKLFWGGRFVGRPDPMHVQAAHE
jgi:putative peptidoglycan binding protein/D-alanyl-D-alanine carboxypeptidase-like protein